jgi:hypothetical protein
MRLLSFIMIAGLLTGCIWPHTTDRSAAVDGRVLDARTHIPIQGAKVFLEEAPHHATYTGSDGRFHLKAIHQFHIGYVPPEGEWPQRKDNSMGVSHANYSPHGFDPGWSGTNNVGDILLKPK